MLEKARDLCVCVGVREACRVDLAALCCLATALHLLTDLLDTIISVLYHPALLSAGVAPVTGNYTWNRL